MGLDFSQIDLTKSVKQKLDAVELNVDILSSLNHESDGIRCEFYRVIDSGAKS